MIRSNIGELAALGTAVCWSLSATSFEVSGKKLDHYRGTILDLQ